MQVLEGEETMVNDLFNLIKQDSRHHYVAPFIKNQLRSVLSQIGKWGSIKSPMKIFRP
jgi:hypothetical protein